MLIYRIPTALILIAGVVWALFFTPQMMFALLSAGMLLLAAWEWARLVGITAVSLRIAYTLGMGVWFCGLGWLWPHGSAGYMGMFAALSISWLGAGVYLKRYPNVPGLSNVLTGVLGYGWLGGCWLSLVFLAERGETRLWLLFMLLLIWAADVGGYVAGRLFGKRKLIPLVSPNKTQEGVLGGLLLSVVVALMALIWLPVDFSQLGALILIAVLSVGFALIGDLWESLLKRGQDLKDSGRLLPGHGGILDRIDSLIAVAPFFAFGWLLFFNHSLV